MLLEDLIPIGKRFLRAKQLVEWYLTFAGFRAGNDIWRCMSAPWDGTRKIGSRSQNESFGEVEGTTRPLDRGCS